MEQNMYTELVSEILKALGDQVLRIVLYGSVARGTASPDSDVDIAVFLPSKMDSEAEDRLSDVIVDMNLKYDKVFSVVDILDPVYKKWRAVTPFYQNVDREGVVLWTAA
nr:nucleotidyltransferase domain-containing protein [Clostridia bacterium]